MSDLQAWDVAAGSTRGDQRVRFVVGSTAADLDWGDWVISHLDGLGYEAEMLEPPLEAGDAALHQVADLRQGDQDLIVVVSGELFSTMGDTINLDQLEPASRPMVVILIEDVELPAVWANAAVVPMYEAPDDYHRSRQLLEAALSEVLAHPLPSVDRAAAEAVDRLRPLPLPIVVDPLAQPDLPAPQTVSANGPNDTVESADVDLRAVPEGPAHMGSAPLADANTVEIIDSGLVPTASPPALADTTFSFSHRPGSSAPAPADQAVPGAVDRSDPATAELPLPIDLTVIEATPATPATPPTPATPATFEPTSDFAPSPLPQRRPGGSPLANAPEPDPADPGTPPVEHQERPAVATAWSPPLPVQDPVMAPDPVAEANPAEAVPAVDSDAPLPSGLTPMAAWPAPAAPPATNPATEPEPSTPPTPGPAPWAPTSAVSDPAPAPTAAPTWPLPPPALTAETPHSMPAVAGTSEDPADPAGLIARDSAPLPRRLGRSSTDPSPVPSLFSGSDWADRKPLEDAVAEAAPAPTAPGTGQDTGPDADDGGLRRRSGLMMPADVATPLQDARSGGASVTETESARSEAGEVTVSGSTAGSTAGLLAAAAVTRVDQPLAGSDDVAASVLDGQPAILRLPFDAPRLLWPLEEVAELLSRGLASRLDNVTSRRADRRGLFNPTPERLDAPRGLAVALIGPLGVGKTTIALAHAHQQLPRLDILWWARGGSEAELRTDLLALAAAVGLDTSGTIDPLSGLRRWLERCQEGWLLIIDELDPSVPVGSMLPRSGRGQIVVTTTAELEGMDTVPVRPPSAAAAHRALQHAATLGTAGGNPETAPAGDQPRDSSLDVLGARLAGQPWALTMAARLLADQVGAATLAGALSNPPHQPLLAGTADGAADAQLLSTLDQLSQRFSEAVPTMLALTALGGTVAAISLADLVDVVDLVGPAGEPSTDQTIGAFLADAARWSLVVTGEDGLMVVPAVAAALQRLQTAEAAAAALTAAAAVGTLPAPATAETVLVDEHADEYADELVEELVEEPVEDAAVETFEMIAHPDGAEPQLIDALSVPAGSLGDFPSQAPEETDSTEPDAEAARLEELRDRGLAAVADGDHFAAALRLEELVVRCDAAFGSSDVRSLSARSDLAAALTAGGSHHRAHQLLAQVLEETRTANGEQHPATFAAMHNLANSHADLGRHREALSLRQAVFDGRRSTLGETHPQTVAALANLANSLALLGRAEEALQARQRVADVRESTLGTDHAHTLGALNNLANSYAEVGRHGDALELRQRVLASRERQLGPDHQHTITARNNLANSLMALGRVAEALSERERTLLDCERVLGVDHPLTITARANVTFGAPTPPSAAPTPGSGPTPFLLPPPNPAVPAPAGPEQDPEPAHSAEQPFGTGFHGPPDSPPAMPIGFDPPAAGPPMQHAAVSSPNWAPPAGSIPNGTPLGGSGVPWPPPASTAPSMADAAPNAWVEPPPRKRRFWFFLFRR